MIRGKSELEKSVYQPEHLEQVVADLRRTFPAYFALYAPERKALLDRTKQVIKEFEKERPAYVELLDREVLAEYAYDPNAFKPDLQTKCPIIRRCLNSQAEVMDNYRRAFYATAGNKMLEVTTRIIEFGQEFAKTFNAAQHFAATAPEALGLSALDDDEYTAYGMIGGGIRSHFLYQLYPHIFANRSQNAIWALYFLTEHKDYGLKDGSEFLMIEETGTQQNYFFPYDLFVFYSNQIYRELDRAATSAPCYLDPKYRYVYLNDFFDHVAELHRSDISTLLPRHEQRFD
jgi:hypothetical protein